MKTSKDTTSIRNGAVDVYKFIFSWFIVMYHFYGSGTEHFHCGHLAIHFYALISGVYFFEECKDAEKMGGGIGMFLKRDILSFFRLRLLLI